MLTADRSGNGDSQVARHFRVGPASKLLPSSLKAGMLIRAQDDRLTELGHLPDFKHCKREPGVSAAVTAVTIRFTLAGACRRTPARR
jgi:hypothetical protein